MYALNKFKVFVLLHAFLICTVLSEERNNAISIGPMLHMNIGKDMNLSIAIEISYWQLKDTPYPWSIDFGIEYGRNAQRIYSELQTGFYLAGISSGIVAELRKGDFLIGYQSSFWANIYGGFDFRYRRINNENLFCPGFYAKAPIFLNE